MLGDFNSGKEKIWRINDGFDKNSDPTDLVKGCSKPPMDRLKSDILNLTAYFCSYMLEQKTLDKARKDIKKEFSFLDRPIKKEFFL